MADYRDDIGAGPSHRIIRHDIQPERDFVNVERETYRERARERSADARAEDYMRARPPPVFFPAPPPPTYIPDRSHSRVRTSGNRVFVTRVSTQRVVTTAEALFNESIQEYYQNGEGIGAIETLLPEDSDDEVPRRLSSLLVTSVGCPHGSRRKRRLNVSTKLGSGGGGGQCECGKEKKPKDIR
jgi:hypothetical protein